ncbi:hypothetical protein ABLE68_15310 [Nocardioides sp. CN2-186]|uniref:hypothetical protein n=1 Tax=Nocardioides tweenelious TaxID=3156607 RepID=UPI0032B5E676
MTDQRLHDLLHETVADVTAPDLADTAWRAGLRGRRRRTTTLVAAAAVAVIAVAGTVALVEGDPGDDPAPTRKPTVAPTQTPTPSNRSTLRSTYEPEISSHDATYSGVPVWWAPTVADEQRLPAYPDSPLPSVVDLSQVSGSIDDDPLDRALAAYGVYGPDGGVEAVDVLGADGRLRSVDVSRVEPMTDPEGIQRVRLGPSLLSRGGDYLMFPQEHSILLYTLRTGRWSSFDTGTSPTWDATWIAADRIVLADPSRPLAQAPEYSVDGVTDGSSNVIGGAVPELPLGSSQLNGRARTGGTRMAQAFTAGATIPEPPGGASPEGTSDWISVTWTPGEILLIPSETGRQKSCCQVSGWIDASTVLYDSRTSTGTDLLAWRVGTGRFWVVTRLTGVTLGQQTVVTSYAQLTPPW